MQNRAEPLSVLVTVATFTEPWEAHLFRLRLEAEGLPAVVAHEHHVWANWPQALALGGVKVQVLREHEAEARAIEARCRAGAYRAELETELGPSEPLLCPNCGSHQVSCRRSLPQLLLLLASYFWAGVIFPWKARVFGCDACGSTWRDGAQSAAS